MKIDATPCRKKLLKVSVEMVMETFRANMQKAIDLIVTAVGKIAETNWDPHIAALEVKFF